MIVYALLHLAKYVPICYIIEKVKTYRTRREEPKTAATEATIRQAKYDKANTSRLMLKLNKKTDADILEKLNSQDNKQGYIKSLIRADIAKSKDPK